MTAENTGTVTYLKIYVCLRIFRKQETTVRLTFFRSERKDNTEFPLYADAFSGMNIRYRNAEDKITAMGAELECEYILRI